MFMDPVCHILKRQVRCCPTALWVVRAVIFLSERMIWTHEGSRYASRNPGQVDLCFFFSGS